MLSISSIKKGNVAALIQSGIITLSYFDLMNSAHALGAFLLPFILSLLFHEEH